MGYTLQFPRAKKGKKTHFTKPAEFPQFITWEFRRWTPPAESSTGPADSGTAELQALKLYLAGGKIELIGNVGTPIDALMARDRISYREALAGRMIEEMRAGLMPPYPSSRSITFDDWRLDRANESDAVDLRRAKYFKAQKKVCAVAGVKAWNAVADVAIHHSWPSGMLSGRDKYELSVLREGLGVLVGHFGLWSGNSRHEEIE